MVDRAVSPPLSVRLEEIRFLTFGRALPATLFAVLGFRVFNNLLAQVAKLPPHASAFDVIAGPFPTALYFLFCSIPVGKDALRKSSNCCVRSVMRRSFMSRVIRRP